MAHAWNACWVNALGGSNPPSSAVGPAPPRKVGPDFSYVAPTQGDMLPRVSACFFITIDQFMSRIHYSPGVERVLS